MKYVLVLALWGAVVGALFGAPEDNRFALVIGNAAYDGGSALANPVNDATDVAASLASVGWKVSSVVNGDLKAMNRAIDRFQEQLAASEHPTALLFYAGHGVQIAGVNYLIPVKESYETAADIQHYAVSLQAILEGFDQANVSTNIVILDACRDNPFLKSSSRSLGNSRGLSVVKQSSVAEGSAIMFSTAPGETAADGTGRNGVFTQALLKYINTDLKLQDLATKVTGDVKKLTGGKQVPFNSISLSEDFYLVPQALREKMAPPPPPPVAQGDTANDPTVLKAGLIVQKQGLLKQRQNLVDSFGWVHLSVGWGGLAVAAVAAGWGGWSALSVAQTLDAYQTASPTQLVDLRQKAVDWNAQFKVGVIVSGVAAGIGILGFLIGADTGSIDQKISDVEKKITLIGGAS